MGLIILEIPSRDEAERFKEFNTININKFLSDPYVNEKYNQLNAAIYRVIEHYRRGASYGSHENPDQLKHWNEAVRLKDEILKEVSILIERRSSSRKAKAAIIISVFSLVVSLLSVFLKK